jgi:hypothetical protein
MTVPCFEELDQPGEAPDGLLKACHVAKSLKKYAIGLRLNATICTVSLYYFSFLKINIGSCKIP